MVWFLSGDKCAGSSSPTRASQPRRTFLQLYNRMQKHRLEAFNDGVLAIIITIMVLELKVPHEVGLAALQPVLPVLLSYVLSFIYVGIYWNNHHQLRKCAAQEGVAVDQLLSSFA